jgi:XTP/dITP diphosphohydrolase
MKLLLASNNANKRKEFQAILPDNIVLLSLQDVGIFEEIPENESTIEGNSLAKARYASEKAGVACIAEDTGLEVLYLNNEPGVRSARYAGENVNSQENIDLLLSNLKTIKERKARFKTVITFYDNGKYEQFEGLTNGSIDIMERGGNGFGYDSVFIPEGHEQTFAEMSFEEKNELSHRKKAIVSFMSFYRKYLDF